MGRRYFGTDGVRGKVGESPITPEFVMHLGYAAGRIFSKGARGKPAVLLGKDTRISGYLLEAALTAGFTAAGVDVHVTGPIPTPASAYLTRGLRRWTSPSSVSPPTSGARPTGSMRPPAATSSSARAPSPTVWT